MNWRPTGSIKNLRVRARLLAQIRDFFAQREILEVDTPALGEFAVTDPHIESFLVPGQGYLQTSPEYAMKRLLASGSGPIYQIAKVFRAAERGARHNREFTLLEWYRPCFDHWQLMDEIAELLEVVLGTGQVSRLSYRDLFMDALGIDPHQADLATLQALAQQAIDIEFDSKDPDHWL